VRRRFFVFEGFEGFLGRERELKEDFLIAVGGEHSE
jgi:hypothetical protein